LPERRVHVERTDIDGISSGSADGAGEAAPIPKQRPRRDLEAARAERRELVRKLERGLQRAQRRDQYRSFLQTFSRFYSLSISNTVLIWRERPHATRVASYRRWLSLGRQVRWGERGIRIMAPTYRRVPPATRPEPGEHEEREIGRLRFRIVSVFDVSQTDAVGEAHPSSLRVHLPGDLDLAPAEAAKICYDVALHLAAHVECRMERKTIAESVACIVLGRFDIQAPDYSFRCLARWSDLATFRARLLDIQAIAIRLIESNEDESDSLPGQPDHSGEALTNTEEAKRWR
jgi:hypothetical protein